jgi:polyphosphate kinase
MNPLVDPDIIDALYEASQAGVLIELVVRGICCLRRPARTFREHPRQSIIGRFSSMARFTASAGTRPAEHQGGCVYLRRHDAAQPRPARRNPLSAANPTVHQQVLEQTQRSRT